MAHTELLGTCDAL